MRKETAIHILKADFINRPNLFVNGCPDYPINYLPPKAPMIRNRTGFFDDVALNEIKTAADSFYYLP